MKSTLCGNECPFVKQGFCSNCKECPNYIETWWQQEGSEQPVKLEDCSPKRMILQQQLMQSRFEMTTQALVQSRNEYNQLAASFKTLIEMAKAIIENHHQKMQKEIENEKKCTKFIGNHFDAV